MAFNLGASIKSNLSSAVVSNVSNKISSAIPGVSSQVVNSTLSSASFGLNAGGIGGVAGNIANGIGNDLMNGIKGKVDGLVPGLDIPGSLAGIVENPLKIVERGAADLIGVTGEEYGLVKEQYLALSKRTAYSGFLNNKFTPSYEPDPKGGSSKIPNPLRDHNSYNYVITLGVLDAAEYNAPESYRSAGGFKNYIIQSSGGNLDKRYQVFDETQGGQSDHAEYYIEDLELDAVITPNANTGIALGTSLSFNVIEPYSMGNFIQAVTGAAIDAGYKSYNTAPFCLKIDFKGWNLDGTTNANFIARPMFVPIKLINMEFNVSGQGSKYAVTAVPMSESGLSDNINKLKTPVRATGLICHEVLETNDASVTSALNSHIEALEESGALAPYDRYIIAFPKDRSTLQNALKQGNIVEESFTTSPEEQQEQRRGVTNPQLRAAFNPQVITITPGSQTYAVLKSFSENKDLMNSIGTSFLNEDTNAPGNSSEADASAVINPETEIVDTQSTAAQPADKARDFQFGQNESITSVIEKVVLQTVYAAERCTENNETGLNKWFKIDTHVFIDENPLTEEQMGRRPRVYVYSVIPYEVDEAVTMGSNDAPANTQGLRDAAVKEYNYIYTGKNEDVLNFDINFNNAFLLTAMSDFGMNGGSKNVDKAKTATTQNKDGGAAVKKDAQITEPVAAPATEIDTDKTVSSGGEFGDIRHQIAEMFHDRIKNMTVDMVTAEMEIMGDPYYIPQETGNYVAELGDQPGVTKDGTMAYQQGPVYAIVNFKTPFDYQVSGATMEYPLAVPGFSGLYQVWAVTNKFNAGKFTQTIKLLRRRGQDKEETGNPKNMIVVDNSADNSKKTVQSDGTVGAAPVTDDCFPAPLNDDIRNLNKAIGADVQNELSAALADAESSANEYVSKLQSEIKIPEAPDLTKIIPGISNAAQVGIGSVSSARIRGAMGSISPVDATNALDVIAAETAVVKQARDAALGGVNKAVESVTGTAKAKAKKLLGPF